MASTNLPVESENNIVSENVILHKLLLRQLKRIDLNYYSIPNNIDDWQQFLKKISNAYIDSDQDRYMVERTMKLSSDEILDLNAKLEYAQKIAKIGYWHLDIKTKKFAWSKEAANILGEEFVNNSYYFNSFLDQLKNEDAEKLDSLVQQVISGHKSVDCEFKITNNSEDLWVYFLITPTHKETLNTISGIIMDITRRKKYEIQVDELNKQLIGSARNVGRADIATSVLHNIGNILNSVNTGVSLIAEDLNKGNVNRICMASEMLEKNSDNLADYLTNDEKGKLVCKYIVSLSKEIKKQHVFYKQECDSLVEYLKHIKDVIRSQQSVAKVINLKTKVNIVEIIDSSIKMTGINFINYNIMLNKEYKYTGDIYIDESKLTQILVNLICNAKDAITMLGVPDYKGLIIIKTELLTGDNAKLLISVIDNGIGIAKENINNIFTFGFTTKDDGHGFGLHSSINSAKEIDAELKVQSAGVNLGANFTIAMNLVSKQAGI